MRTSWITVTGTAAAALLVLSGCSNSPEGEEEVERASIGSLMGQPSYEDVDWQDQERKVQEAVSECMREEGWEYIPVEYPDWNFEYDPAEERTRLEEQGFGIVFWTLNQNYEDPNDPYKDWVDPNQEYVEGLSEDEMTAYYESLYGTPEEQEAATVTEVDPETGEEYQVQYGNGPGCQGEAYTEVNGEDPTQTPGYWEAVQVYYDELQERAEADPRIVEINETWSKCMKEAGYEFKDQNELWETGMSDIQERHDAIAGDLYKDPMEGWTEDEMNDFWENATEEEIDELYNTSVELTDEQRSTLEELLEEEIALALAQFDCSENYNEKYSDIYAEIEEQYALEHEDELRELAASLATS